MNVPVLPHPRSEILGQVIRVVVEARVFVPARDGAVGHKEKAIARALVRRYGDSGASFVKVELEDGSRVTVFLEEVLRSQLSPVQDTIPS